MESDQDDECDEIEDAYEYEEPEETYACCGCGVDVARSTVINIETDFWEDNCVHVCEKCWWKIPVAWRIAFKVAVAVGNMICSDINDGSHISDELVEIRKLLERVFGDGCKNGGK